MLGSCLGVDFIELDDKFKEGLILLLKCPRPGECFLISKFEVLFLYYFPVHLNSVSRKATLHLCFGLILFVLLWHN